MANLCLTAQLDDQPIAAIMTPRRDIYIIDLDDDEAFVQQRIMESQFSRLVVTRNGFDNILGVLQTADLRQKILFGTAISLKDIAALA
jgi:putative hemolysin